MTKGVNTGAMWMKAQDASSAADLVPIQVGAEDAELQQEYLHEDMDWLPEVYTYTERRLTLLMKMLWMT